MKIALTIGYAFAVLLVALGVYIDTNGRDADERLGSVIPYISAIGLFAVDLFATLVWLMVKA